MATNDFKPFAIGSGANVTAQADWEALAALATGFQSGVAKSAQVNKALRQGSVMAYLLGQFIADQAEVDATDDGDTATLLTNFVAALKAANESAGFLNKSNNLSDVLSAATALANLGGLAKSSNLSDLASIPTAIANLGLGTAATRNVGTGANQIPDMTSWTSGGDEIAGWRICPDGFIEQWGQSGSATGGRITVSFPISFPTKCLTIQITEMTASSVSPGSSVQSWGLNYDTISNTAFSVVNGSASSTENMRWRALGK